MAGSGAGAPGVGGDSHAGSGSPPRYAQRRAPARLTCRVQLEIPSVASEGVASLAAVADEAVGVFSGTSRSLSCQPCQTSRPTTGMAVRP